MYFRSDKHLGLKSRLVKQCKKSTASSELSTDSDTKYGQMNRIVA